MALRVLFLALCLFAGLTHGEARQAEVCSDSTHHQSGYCPADLSSPDHTGETASGVTCAATSDVTDGTQYCCITTTSTPLSAAGVAACSGGVGNSAAVADTSPTVSITGLAASTSYYAQMVNLSPEQWYSNVVVSSQFQTASSGVAATGRFICSDGNDSNDGTSHAQRWATTANATGLPAGTDVWFCADDTFNTDFNPDWNGTSEDHVYIGTYTGTTSPLQWMPGDSEAKAIFTQVLTGNDYVMRPGGDYIHFTSLDLRANNNTNGSGRPGVIRVENDVDNTFIGPYTELEGWDSEADAIAARVTNRVDGISLQRATNVTIDDVAIRWVFQGVIGDDATQVTVQNSHIREYVRNGVHMYADDSPASVSNLEWVIQNNIIHDSYDSDGIQIDPSGKSASELMRRVEILGNHLWNFGEQAIDIKGARYVLVDGNLATRSEGVNDGVGVSGCTTSTAWSSAFSIHRGGGSNVLNNYNIVRRNIVYDGNSAISSAEGWWSYNNTVIGNKYNCLDGSGSTTTSSGGVPLHVGLHGPSSGAGANVFNNISVANGNDAAIRGAGSGNWTGYIDYNVYGTDFGDPNFAIRDGVGDPTFYTSVSAWSAGLDSALANTTGDEVNSTQGDIDFVSLATASPSGDYFTQGYDFNLQATSAAVDAGRAHATATNSGSNSLNLTVGDTCAFWSNTWGVSGGDYIKIGSQPVARIGSLSCPGTSITLATGNERTWSTNDDVFLSNAAGDTLNDAGACERSAASTPCDPAQWEVQ